MLQVVIDCAHPHDLVEFWAEAFGYEVENNDELVRQVLAAGQTTEDDVVDLGGRLAWRELAAARHPEYGRLLFQLVPEPKTVKNRVHLDFHPDGDRDAEVQRLLDLGATKLYDKQVGPMSWVTMADPEGNEFCIA